MTRFLRTVAAALLAAVSVLAIQTPARAGGWAATMLDPLPERLAPGTAYTVGYWVLQHGFHPFEGDLGATELRLTDAAGNTKRYPGSALPEAGHYAAAVQFAGTGTWRLSSWQGLFGEFQIGEITVPGGLTLSPPEYQVTVPPDNADHWAAIKPPLATPPAPPATTKAAAVATDTGGSGGGFGPAVPVAGGVLAVAILALLLVRRARGRMTAAPPRSADREEGLIVIER
jgi:hypothetical protein